MGVFKFPRVEDVKTWEDFRKNVLGTEQNKKGISVLWNTNDVLAQQTVEVYEYYLGTNRGDILKEEFKRYKENTIRLSKSNNNAYMVKIWDYLEHDEREILRVRVWMREINGYLEKLWLKFKTVNLEQENDARSKLEEMNKPRIKIMKGKLSYGIEQDGFFNMYQVTKVILDSRFENYTNLEEVVIADEISIIGDSAFEGCTRLKKVDMSESTELIGDGSFAGCKSLKSIEIPTKTKRVGKKAFEGCTSLEKIIIKSSDVVFEWGAFSGCNNIKEIYIPEKDNQNMQYQLYNAGAMMSSNIALNGNFVNMHFGNNKSPDSPKMFKITAIPSVENISNWQDFRDEVIGIPNSAELKRYLGGRGPVKPKGLVAACERNRGFSFGYTYENWVTDIMKISEKFRGGIILDDIDAYMKQTERFDTKYKGKSEERARNKITLLKSRGNNADKLAQEKIKTLKAKTRRLYDNFMAELTDKYSSYIDCRKTKKIKNKLVLKDIVVSGDIPNEYFTYCKNLETVVCDESVTKIGQSAFASCASLSKITIPGTVETIGKWAFYNATQLKEVEIGRGVGTIEGYAFDRCTSLREITIPDTVKMIGEGAFYRCDSLSKITIPGSVETISKGAFADDKKLEEVKIGKGVRTIGELAFLWCESLRKITIPGNVATIGRGAFSNNRQLKEVEIEEGVERIETKAFYNTGIESIRLPRSLVTNFEPDIFEKCNSLEEVYVDPEYIASVRNHCKGKWDNIKITPYGLSVSQQPPYPPPVGIEDNPYKDYIY